MSNPYEPPTSTPFSGTTVGGEGRDKLRRVAKYQRWVLFALLVNIVANIIGFATSSQESMAVRIGVMVIGLAAAIFAITSVILLAKELTHIAVAIICGVLMCIPCVSLITLLVLNQMATTYLQKNGVKVGFMGTNPDQI